MDSMLLEDNPHWIKKPNEVYNDYTHREQLDTALAYLSAKEIIAIIGARRVGKSSLTKLMIKLLLKETNPKNIFFINLEKPSFIPYKNDPIGQLCLVINTDSLFSKYLVIFKGLFFKSLMATVLMATP